MSKKISYKIRQQRWSAAVLVLIISLAGAACSPRTADAPTQAAVPTAAQPTAAPTSTTLRNVALTALAVPTAAPTLTVPTLAPTSGPAPSSTTKPTEVPRVTPGPEAKGLIATFTSGENVIVFDQNGRFQVGGGGAVVDSGTFTVAGNQLTLFSDDFPGSCYPHGPGVYRWKLTDTFLRLTMVQDECEPRALGLPSTLWTAQ